MEYLTDFVLYTLIWWTVLFAVLPFGTRPEADPDGATGWRGAPAKPMMARKLIATTLVSAVLWAGAMLLINSGLIGFRGSSVMG